MYWGMDTGPRSYILFLLASPVFREITVMFQHARISEASVQLFAVCSFCKSDLPSKQVRLGLRIANFDTAPGGKSHPA